MDIKIGYNREYITYGTVVSLMLDYYNSDESGIVPNVQEYNENKSLYNKSNVIEYLTSKEFLFTHGVFNEYCFLHQFKDAEDLRDGYLNTAFIVLPAFEFESMDNLNKLIKKAKKTGIAEHPENDEIRKSLLLDYYKKFMQEIHTNHDKSLKLMNKESKENQVHYYDCFQLMHLKSGNFLEYKRSNKDLKTYIQLTSSMSKRTLFRFIPSFDYQTENSTNVFFYLSVQIACGEKKNKKEKYMSGVSPKSRKKGRRGSVFKRNSIYNSFGVNEDEDEEEEIDINIKKNEETKQEKPIYEENELKNIIKDVYNDENQEEKIIDEFVSYSINENLFQKNVGAGLMPEDNYVIMDDDEEPKCFWRLINLSEDFFEDLKYLNLFDYFCIQSPDKNLFVHVDIGKNEDPFVLLSGDNINNTRNELKPIKEEKEDKSENKDEDKNESKDKNKSENKEEDKSENQSEINIINTQMNNNFTKINFQGINNKIVSNSFPSFLDNHIQLDYYYESNINSNKQYKLKVESYNDNEHLKPYSLFRFEPNTQDFERGEFGFGSLAKFNVLEEKVDVRIFNTFTNKVLYAEKYGKNKYKLFLIDDIKKDDKRYQNTIFQIEQLDSEDVESEEDESEKKEEKKESNSEEKDDDEKKKNIKKNNFIKIYSKKFLSYLGIRIKNDRDCGELILTNSIADITRFQLNCIDEEDKHEVNFFEQLLLGFNNILNYFRQENKSVNIYWKNYERISHLLTKFKNKLDMFQKDEKEDSNLKLQKNKFDFLDIIEHFKIVSKLIEIFLANWFQNYQIYSYEQLEEKLKKYFQENNEILKYKLIISRVILEILNKIYDLKKKYLEIIKDSLIYFLMFVCRDDQCTSFLIHILKDNAPLLVGLCPLYENNLIFQNENTENEENLNELNNMSLNLTLDNEEIQKRRKRFQRLKYQNIEKCFKRILNDYNNIPSDKLRINFYSLDLFFVFLSTLLLYNGNPFERFYVNYFSNLGLLKNVEGNVILVPNYEQNHILTYFYLKDDEIYARSFPFFDNDKNNKEKIWEYKLTDLVDIIGNYNLETEEDRNKIFFAKLVNLNLNFYSFLSICDERFKEYLKEIFKFENVNRNFFTDSYNEIINPNEINIKTPEKIKKSPLLNEIKCSIMQMFAFLYLKQRNPYIAKTHLFKCINGENNENNLDIKIPELAEIIKFIKSIFPERDKKLELNKIEFLNLIEFIELIKFTLRNLYLLKDNKNDSTRKNIYSLMESMIRLFGQIIGFNIKEFEDAKKLKEEQERIEKEYEKKYGKKLKKNYEEKRKEKTLEDTLNEKLELKNPILLVSENFDFVFIKIKKKVKNLVLKPKEKNFEDYFINILKEICDANIIQKTRYDLDFAKKIKQNKKLLKKFDLTSVLMNISVLSNRNISFLKSSILYRIEEIIKEFLQYLEYSTMEDLGKNIPITETITREDYLEGIKKEVYANKNKISTKYLDEFRQQKYNNSSVISLSFFKFLQLDEDETLKNLALDILFY